MRLAAVVLSGGSARRLDGRDKAAVRVGGVTLLERVLAAVRDAEEVVVVGPPAPAPARVAFVREDPPGGGPVAGLVAGQTALSGSADLLAVVAVDMPYLSADTFARLAAAAEDADGAFLVSGGRRHLAGVLRPDRVAWPAAPDAHGMPMHRLLAPLRLTEVEASGDEARDVDTWADLRALE